MAANTTTKDRTMTLQTMTLQTMTLRLQHARYALDRMLADFRTTCLQTQDGRAFLDEAPEDIRRMLKHSTWTLAR